jgi:hypothetical protein
MNMNMNIDTGLEMDMDRGTNMDMDKNRVADTGHAHRPQTT